MCDLPTEKEPSRCCEEFVINFIFLVNNDLKYTDSKSLLKHCFYWYPSDYCFIYLCVSHIFTFVAQNHIIK